MRNHLQTMRLHRCFQVCFLGLHRCVKVHAFQTSFTGSGLSSAIIRNSPRKTFTSYHANGLSTPTQRRTISIFGAALDPQAEVGAEKTNDNITEKSTEPNDGANNDPIICRVVATSDGKISPLPALASLSASSKSLLEKIELLYSVKSQKQLRDLAYMLPRSTPDKRAYHDELSSDAMKDSEGGAPDEPPITNAMDGIEQEEKLVSILKQSLDDGGFKLLNQRDRDLCSALNAAYLLRLSLNPDVKELDPCIGKEFYPELYYEQNEKEIDGGKGGGANNMIYGNDANDLLFDGRVLIFRRGYSEEITTGRLLLPKLDYLQASLVQRSSTTVTRRLGEVERGLENIVFGLISRLNDAVQRVYRGLVEQCKAFTVDVLENFGLSKNELVAGIIANDLQPHGTSDGSEDSAQTRESGNTFRKNRIFKLGRYRTSTSAIIPDSLDLSDALSPFMLCEVGDDIVAETVEQDMYNELNPGEVQCQYDDTVASLREADSERNSLLESSYKPAAVRLLKRVSIQNTVDFFSSKGRRELIKNYFKSSTLVEPAYEEVIVIWRPLRKKKPRKIQFPPKWVYDTAQVFDMEDRLPPRKNNTQSDAFDDKPMPLEIKAFYDVPMANIEAVLPKTKLVFRPADAIVFDSVSVVSFLAVAGSLKFDSPNLDVIALVSLVFFAVRTFFRYSNKYARYDLLVNKFLTSKISHRGPGALKYIVSEADSNKALRSLLIRDWLSKGKKSNLDASMLEQGKSYVNNMSSISASQIDVDVQSAINDLKDLELIGNRFEVKEEQESQDSMKKLWDESFE